MVNNVISAQSLRDADWNTILERINGGNCTPFIGSGARIGGPTLMMLPARGLANSNIHLMTTSIYPK